MVDTSIVQDLSSLRTLDIGYRKIPLLLTVLLAFFSLYMFIPISFSFNPHPLPFAVHHFFWTILLCIKCNKIFHFNNCIKSSIKPFRVFWISIQTTHLILKIRCWILNFNDSLCVNEALFFSISTKHTLLTSCLRISPCFKFFP